MALKRYAPKLPNKQPRPRRRQERHTFAYLTMKKERSFARFARAFFVHFAFVVVLPTT